MMPPFIFVFPTNRIAYFVEVSLFYLAQRVNLISQSIKNYNTLYNASEGESKIAYLNLILHLNERKYVLHGSFTWVLPVAISVTNFMALIISILVDLKDLKILT